MSFLTASHSTHIVAPIPPHITKSQAISLLHNNSKMIALNPIVTAHHRLPDSASLSFFKSEKKELKPGPDEATFPVYSVTESMKASEEGNGTWRGSWAKHFIPEAITYEMSHQCKENGLVSVAHAPMGVHSITTWLVKEGEGGEGLVLEESGTVTSNRVLMGFIRTTLQESHEKMVKQFMEALEKEDRSEGEPVLEREQEIQ